MGKLEGRAAVVTGGGKGVGKGISLCLAAEGAGVCIGYNSNEELARQTLWELEDAGGQGFLFQADVSDPAQCAAMAEETARRFGGIDILVNNAGLQKNLDIPQYSEEEYDRILQVNLFGYVYMMQACLPWLKKSGRGNIVNISSVHGKRPGDFDPVYSMSKGAMHMLTREAAVEFARYGIRVNTLLPAGVKIEFKTGRPPWLHAAPPPNADGSPAKRFPTRLTGRGGLPADLGRACVYLVSDDAAWVTGSALRMDGGAMLV